MDDLADACVFLMNHYSGNETVNVGTGKELTIKELTELAARGDRLRGKDQLGSFQTGRHAEKASGCVQGWSNLGWKY